MLLTIGVEFVTEDVHRTLSTTHDSARKRVSRTNLQYSNNNMEDNEFGKPSISLLTRLVLTNSRPFSCLTQAARPLLQEAEVVQP